jgi:hypothetical protein
LPGHPGQKRQLAVQDTGQDSEHQGHYDEDDDRAAGEVLSYTIAGSRIEQRVVILHCLIPGSENGGSMKMANRRAHRTRWSGSSHRAEHTDASAVQHDHAKIATVDADPGARRRGLRR